MATIFIFLLILISGVYSYDYLNCMKYQEGEQPCNCLTCPNYCGPCEEVKVIDHCKLQNQWALTFNGGPMEQWNKVLDILNGTNVKATFFVVGKIVPDYPDLMKRIINAGHEIGIHGYNFVDYNKLTEDQIKEELKLTQAELAKFGLEPVYLFRPPYLKMSEEKRKIYQTLGLEISYYNFYAEDVKSSADFINKVNIKLSHNASNIIHLVETYSDNEVNALPDIIMNIADHHYNMVTMNECLGKGNTTTVCGITVSMAKSATRWWPAMTIDLDDQVDVIEKAWVKSSDAGSRFYPMKTEDWGEGVGKIWSPIDPAPDGFLPPMTVRIKTFKNEWMVLDDIMTHYKDSRHSDTCSFRNTTQRYILPEEPDTNTVVPNGAYKNYLNWCLRLLLVVLVI